MKKQILCFALVLFFALTARSNTVTIKVDETGNTTLTSITHCWDKGFFIGAGYGLVSVWDSQDKSYSYYPIGNFHIGYNFKY